MQNLPNGISWQIGRTIGDVALPRDVLVSAIPFSHHAESLLLSHLSSRTHQSTPTSTRQVSTPVMLKVEDRKDRLAMM